MYSLVCCISVRISCKSLPSTILPQPMLVGAPSCVDNMLLFAIDEKRFYVRKYHRTFHVRIDEKACRAVVLHSQSLSSWDIWREIIGTTRHVLEQLKVCTKQFVN